MTDLVALIIVRQCIQRFSSAECLPLEICLYDRLPVQSVAIGVIGVRNVHVQKSGLPTVNRRTEKIDSSSAKGRGCIVNFTMISDSEGTSRERARCFPHRPSGSDRKVIEPGTDPADTPDSFLLRSLTTARSSDQDFRGTVLSGTACSPVDSLVASIVSIRSFAVPPRSYSSLGEHLRGRLDAVMSTRTRPQSRRTTTERPRDGVMAGRTRRSTNDTHDCARDHARCGPNE